MKTKQRGGGQQIWGKSSTPNELKQHVYLTYRTISDEGIDAFVRDIGITKDDVFYDLGSGVGNVCDRVFKTTYVRKCVGIEYDNDRYNYSVPLNRRTSSREVRFIQGNFMDQDWSDATILFMDSIMFSEDTLKEIEIKARQSCPHLRYVISMKSLPNSTQWTHLKTVKVKVSWGSSQYNLYKVK